MAITWDNSQDYSGSPSGAPGFWFGPYASVNSPPSINKPASGEVQLNPNAMAAKFGATITDLTVPAGTITPQNKTISVAMSTSTASLGPIEVTADATYNGTYTYVPYADNDEPSLLGQFSLSNIKATTNGEEISPGTEAYNTISKLIKGLSANYLYLQLNPGYPTPPLTAGAVVTLTYGSWTFDGEVPSLEIVCFLAGSMITTNTGSKAVEDLVVGDLILTGSMDNQKLEPVTWIGRGHANVRPNLPDDRAGYPVCIRKGAFGENSPNADLYVTPEHTLYIEERLVPARMLVNHRSIIYAYDRLSYDYYHFETAAHSIVYANNLATESYLDTGNRRSFLGHRQTDNIILFPSSQERMGIRCLRSSHCRDGLRPPYLRKASGTR